MASHLIECPAGRCTEIEHVDANKPCTWLSVSDVNQATDITLEGPDVRELGLALGRQYTSLLKAGETVRAERVRNLARTLGVDELRTLLLP